MHYTPGRRVPSNGRGHMLKRRSTGDVERAGLQRGALGKEAGDRILSWPPWSSSQGEWPTKASILDDRVQCHLHTSSSHSFENKRQIWKILNFCTENKPFGQTPSWRYFAGANRIIIRAWDLFKNESALVLTWRMEFLQLSLRAWRLVGRLEDPGVDEPRPGALV